MTERRIEFISDTGDSEHLVGIAYYNGIKVSVYTVVDWPDDVEEPYILAGEPNEFTAFWKYSVMEEKCPLEDGVERVIEVMTEMLEESMRKVEGE